MAEITVSQAIDAIKTAAVEIDPEDFISYSTILDVHISHAHDHFHYEDQAAFLGAVKEVLEEHEALARNIAWDLISVLLPFVQEPFSEKSEKANEIVRNLAQECLMTAAEVGNPREVFLKVVGAISNLSFSLMSNLDEDDEDDGLALGGRAEARTQANGLLKFHQLLLLLSQIHLRLQAKFPSRFLSNSLSSLLSAFTHATQSLPPSSVGTLVQSILNFVDHLPATRRIKGVVRPPLPPRVSTGSVLTASEPPADSTAGNASEKTGPKENSEELLEKRLLQSFLTHILEIYALRCRSEPSENPGAPTRGIYLRYAVRYFCLNAPKKRLTGGFLDSDANEILASSGVVGSIAALASKLQIDSKELLQLCLKEEEDLSDDEDSEIPAPSSHSDVPLSRRGALLLLAHRYFDVASLKSNEPEKPNDAELNIFPSHAKILEIFVSNNDSGPEISILDAVLFLGRYALQSNTLGPKVSEDGVISYIQALSLLSATCPDRSLSFLAFEQLADTLRLLSDDKLRFNIIQSILQTCPFENLRCALIGLLKDFIYEGCVGDRPFPSIFTEANMLVQIRSSVFPDLNGRNLEEDMENSPEIFTTFLQACNLLSLVTRNEQVAGALQISSTSFVSDVFSTFFTPLEAFVSAREQEQDGNISLGGLSILLDSLKQPLKSPVESKASV